METAAAAAPAQQGLGAHGTPLRAGEWGAGRPSFWCCREAEQVFLIREADATCFRREHPMCIGADLKATLSVVEKATVNAKLAVFEPPSGAITHVRKRGAERFPNERGQLTEAGALCLERGVRKNLIVWRLWFRCAGLNTYRCVSDGHGVIHHTPEATQSTLGSVSKGQVVQALAHKVVADKSVWIQLHAGWVCVVTADGTIALQATGCERQCGGVCRCTSTCANQIKGRHGCNVQIKMERTLQHVQNGLVRIAVTGTHAADASQWAALPPERRAVSPETRHVILQKIAEKSTARKVQLHLNATARSVGAAVNAPGISAFMARVQSAAGKLFTF